MSVNYAQQFNRKQTSQRRPARKDQVKNNAGGYTFQVGNWATLDRFLILGSEGGTYYVKEQDLTKQNHDSIVICIKEDGPRVVARTMEISTAGRAPKNTPAEFVLALCLTHGDEGTKKAAYEAIPGVCRIGTHLFHLVNFTDQMRGWSRGLRNAVGNWYLCKEADKLAHQVVKYQQRDGWSHRDVLRKAHVRLPEDRHPFNAVLRWAVGESLGARTVTRRSKGGERKVDYADVSDVVPSLISAYEEAKTADTKRLVSLITEHGLTREMVPTNKLNELEVWEALLENMPMTAMVRNLGKMTSIGLVKPLSAASKKVAKTLKDSTALERSRIHPMALLIALRTYENGRGDKGGLTWQPVPAVAKALDEAFYGAFGNVTPTGKPILYGVDVSGSMSWSKCAGLPITPAEGAAAMALVSASVEDDYHIMGFANSFRELDIRPGMSLRAALEKTSRMSFGSTDCSLPAKWALQNRVEVGGFVVITDNETWSGNLHPFQAMQEYRSRFVADARLVVMGMASNGFTINDPQDPYGLDVVGFDSAAPAVVADFIRGA